MLTGEKEAEMTSAQGGGGTQTSMPMGGDMENGGEIENGHESPVDDDDDEQQLDLQQQQLEELLIPAGGDDVSTKKRMTSKKSGGSNDYGSTTTPSGKKLKKKVRKSSTPTGDHLHHHDADNATAIFIKYAALFLLVAQMVGLVLLMRYSRTNSDPAQPLYLASTAVFIMEVMKLVLCVGVIWYQSECSFPLLMQELHRHIIGSPFEILKLCVPSLLYTIQNNLLYLALTNLDAATYQVCYQLKILTTALFSSLLLGRTFSTTKWASLVLLTVGVAVVQISGSSDQHAHEDSAQENRNRWIGTVAVLCAACTSGFSGVYFEKILKGSRTSLWIRNVQMGLPSTIIAYLAVYFKDRSAIATQGFFGGYTTIVWTVVTVQAVGGLIVAVVVRYADNVLKVFATSFSIVVSCIISAFLFDFHPTFLFLVGASLVVTATVMYSSPERPRGQQQQQASTGLRDRAKRQQQQQQQQHKPVLPVTVQYK